jgi:uncharacterized protein (TIGR01777 family)
MGFEHTADFDHPLPEVFAWHTRPGAITRLTPPWQPVRVLAEATSLRDGRAVLGMPAGLKWVAEHRPDGYEEGRRFTDELATPLIGSLIRWRHTHVFDPVDGDSATRLTDRVETAVPSRLVASMFAYRTRQLRGDLDSHRRWRSENGKPLTVAVTGGSGLIGTALCALLTTGGHRVVKLARSAPAARGGTGGAVSDRHWDPLDPDPGLLDGVDALVHLAGASISGRFNAEHKRQVRDSRIEPTRRLAELAARQGLATFVSASAIGIYGADRGDEELTESSGRGKGFLADVVADWETATSPASAAGVRVPLLRTGIVQSPKGGALQLLRLLFETGLGGRLGDGTAWMSWIGIDDIVDIYLHAIFDERLDGPVNAVAPEPVRNADYTRVLAHVLRRPAVLPVPGFGPRLLLGKEGATEVAMASQRVVPARLEEVGHRFRHRDLEGALRHVLGRTDAEDLAQS